MKILLVNQTFYPDVVSTAQHLTDLAIALKAKGHEVLTLTSRRGYSAPYPHYPQSETYEGIKIVRVWPYMFGRKNKIIRGVDALCVNLAFFFHILFLSRVDTIVALTSPPLVSFFACIAAQLKRSHFVYWVMDMNPDEAIAMGWIKEASWAAQILKRCQAFVVKHSDRIIALDSYMRSRLMRADSGAYEQNAALNLCHKKTDCEKIVIIPPWAHDERLEAVFHQENPFRRRYKLENKFVVMYSGNHSVCHPLDTVLSAAQLLAEDESIVFMFIGGGVRVQDVLDFKIKNQLRNILQVDYVPLSELKFSLSAADLHVVVMGNNMAGIVHPCKIYGVLALGKPFIYVGPTPSHIVDLISQGAAGGSVNHGESEKFAQYVRQSQSVSRVELDKISFRNHKIAEMFSEKQIIPRAVETIVKL